MKEGQFWFIYGVIGIAYYCVNIFVRKLHTKNENSEGWFLVPFWVFGWPLCFIMIIAAALQDKIKSRSDKF